MCSLWREWSLKFNGDLEKYKRSLFQAEKYRHKRTHDGKVGGIHNFCSRANLSEEVSGGHSIRRFCTRNKVHTFCDYADLHLIYGVIGVNCRRATQMYTESCSIISQVASFIMICTAKQSSFIYFWINWCKYMVLRFAPVRVAFTYICAAD